MYLIFARSMATSHLESLWLSLLFELHTWDDQYYLGLNTYVWMCLNVGFCIPCDTTARNSGVSIFSSFDVVKCIFGAVCYIFETFCC